MKESEAFDFSRLVLRYLRMELTPDEEHLFLAAIASDSEKQALLDYYKNTVALEKDLSYMDRLNPEGAWDKVMERVPVPSSPSTATKHPFFRKWLRYAAVITAAAIAAIWWYSSGQDNGIIMDSQYGFKNDVLPGSARAMLILSNGKTVELSQSGQSIMEGKQAISESKNGNLSYRQGDGSSQHGFNEVRVPYSGQYKVTLSDGTLVWMNSLSKLKFPVQFNANERRVTLEGEAFFDVAKDADRPFYVEVGGRTIKVLGTKFNVSAYSDEVATTLVEGAVTIVDAHSVSKLEPGQQAVCTPSGITVLPANLEKATAWTAGYFVFDQDNIQTIMEQVARWYEVKVHYEGEIYSEIYSGSVSRSSTLGGVLRMLMDVGNLQFKIDGRDVTVTNKDQVL